MMTPGSANALLLADAGYQIQRSVRLRSSASGYFSRTPASAGNQQKFTLSALVKRGAIGTSPTIFGCYSSGSQSQTNAFDFRFNTDTLDANWGNGTWFTTTAIFRDPAAWYHIVLAVDTTQATAANRMILYVNGVIVTAFSTASYPAQNTNLIVNSTNGHTIGKNATGSAAYLDGYLTDINFIDGQALTPAAFGEINPVTGVWSAKKYAGTYGTNGFFLNFSDNSAATAAAIGKDSSGNGNNWTPSGVSVTAGVTYDSMLDVPLGAGGPERGNYCVLSPLDKSTYITHAEANLKATCYTLANGAAGFKGSMAVSSGKWYWEVRMGANQALRNTNWVGIDKASSNNMFNSVGTGAVGYGYTQYTGSKSAFGVTTAYGATWTNGDIIGTALDLDAGTIEWFKNGVSQGVAFTGIATDFWVPSASLYTDTVNGSYTADMQFNFGQRPFAYTPPTGFKALHTGNLPEPVIKQGASYMAATLYTGNGTSSRAISNAVNGVSFQPDFTWIKSRSNVRWHLLTDAVRGATKTVFSNDTSAEQTLTDALLSFNSDGFSVGANTDVNANANTFVAWQWKANGAAVSNTAGSITSQVSAGVSQGFSVVTYTGNGTAGATVGHGLGVAPNFVIAKPRSTTGSWIVGCTPIGWGNQLALESTGASAAYGGFSSTAPSSTVITLGNNGSINGSGTTFVAYCFSEVAGYSKFGSYTGNGSADGPFVFTGFRPAFVLIKNASTGGIWYIWDNKRIIQANGDAGVLQPQSSEAEADYNASGIDLLSNGFKIRNTDTSDNNSGATIVYAAFAEHPFKNSLAR